MAMPGMFLKLFGLMATAQLLDMFFFFSWTRLIGHVMWNVYWVVAELVFRANTSDVNKSNDTKGSTGKAMRFILGFNLVPMVWRLLGLSELFGGWLALAALVATGFMLCGCALRWKAMSLLGKSFSRTLKEVEGGLITHGPYAIVRHPGYLSNLLVYLGYAILVAESLVVPAAVLAVFVRVWGERITWEEEVMESGLKPGEYAAYRKKTPWRLIPLLY